jgi:hypothetical protein
VFLIGLAAGAFVVYRRRTFQGTFNVRWVLLNVKKVLFIRKILLLLRLRSMYFRNNELTKILPQDMKPTPFPRTTTSPNLMASAPTVNTLNKNCHEFINDEKIYQSATSLNLNVTDANESPSDEDTEEMDYSTDPHQRLIF